MSKLEDEFFKSWTEGVTGWNPERQYKFHPDRRWRFDFAWPDVKVAVETYGFGYWQGKGQYRLGGHQTEKGMSNDAEKIREAIKLGWTVLVFTSKCLGSKEQKYSAVDDVFKVLENRCNVNH